MFSKAGQVISKRRARMLPDMAQDLVLISEWSKQPHFKFSECLDSLVRLDNNDADGDDDESMEEDSLHAPDDE
tara:strand:- start:617 stop:835 length:219 start_codon:yes stop_codon:yes gene_type:complete